MVPVELSDDRGLLGNLEHSSSQAVTPEEERPAKRRALRRADYTSSQILQPHTPSSIEKATLQGLWDVVIAGNKWKMYFSYLADSEPLRQGVALGQFAQTLKHAIMHFKESRVRIILKEEVYAKVKDVADEIFPHLETLDGGYLAQRAHWIRFLGSHGDV